MYGEWMIKYIPVKWPRKILKMRKQAIYCLACLTMIAIALYYTFQQPTTKPTMKDVHSARPPEKHLLRVEDGRLKCRCKVCDSKERAFTTNVFSHQYCSLWFTTFEQLNTLLDVLNKREQTSWKTCKFNYLLLLVLCYCCRDCPRGSPDATSKKESMVAYDEDIRTTRPTCVWGFRQMCSGRIEQGTGRKYKVETKEMVWTCQKKTATNVLHIGR